MSYNPTTDFLGLLRSTAGGVRITRMPGIDWLIEALSRLGFASVSVSLTAPTVNQQTTAWFQPSTPDWSAEGQLFLWNPVAAAYQPATPALWNVFFLPTGYAFQSARLANNNITAGTSLLAVQRAAPAATALVMPNLAAQFNFGRDVSVIDFSTGVANHVITITTPDGTTIMQGASWQLLSTANQLAGIRLKPSPDLNAWIIAP